MELYRQICVELEVDTASFSRAILIKLIKKQALPSHIQNLSAPGLQGRGQKPFGRRLPPGRAGLPPAPPQNRRHQTEPLL
ncbi:hypothetical protein DFAR_530016 [Desulfarculales bacterium]